MTPHTRPLLFVPTEAGFARYLGEPRQFAMLEPPPPEMQQLFAALRSNQPATDRFMGTLAGTTPIPEFFAPDNIGRIMAAATEAVPA